MKFKALMAALAVCGLATASIAQQPPAGPPPGAPAGPPRGGGLPPPEPIEHITGNVYKIFGGGGNTLVVVQNDGVVLVDTKMPGNGEAILSEVAKVTDKPIKLIINTHSHPDHLGSNGAIRAKYPQVRIVMSEGTKAEMSGGPGASPENLPTETYKGRLTIGSGDDRLELYQFGPGHTNGDTFVVVPAAKLLFMGDVMAWNMAPFLPAGGAENISKELEDLVATVKDMGIEIVVEGHGHVNTWQGLTTLTKFHRELVTRARAAYDRGDAPGVVVREMLPNPEYADLLDTQIKKGLEYGNTPRARAHMNVNVAYAEFAGEQVGFAIANGGPLPATDKHKGSDPADTVAPRPGS